MRTLYLILYIIAAACFLATALGIAPKRVSLLPLGLLAWVLVPLIIEARLVF